MIAALTLFLLLGKITRDHKRTDCICTVGSACHCKALLLRVGRSGGTSATCELLEAKLNANRHNISLSSLFRSTRLDSCSTPMINQHDITLINAKFAFKLMFWKSQSSPWQSAGIFFSIFQCIWPGGNQFTVREPRLYVTTHYQASQPHAC